MAVVAMGAETAVAATAAATVAAVHEAKYATVSAIGSGGST